MNCEEKYIYISNRKNNNNEMFCCLKKIDLMFLRHSKASEIIKTVAIKMIYGNFIKKLLEFAFYSCKN